MVRQYLEKPNVRFIRLNPQNTIKKFTCGDPDLDDFICNRASEFQKHFKDKMEFNRFRKKQGFPNEKRLKSYPAVKLCRLGVDVCAKGLQIGSTVLDCIKAMFFFDNKTGGRFLTVDAYLNAVPFYEKNGFRFMNAEDDDPHTRLMYYDLMNLVA